MKQVSIGLTPPNLAKIENKKLIREKQKLKITNLTTRLPDSNICCGLINIIFI